MNNHRSIQGAFIAIMRITLAQIFIMAVFSTLVSASSLSGQGIMDRKVSINVHNAEMKSILSEIEKQTSVVFTYRANLIKGLKNVSVLYEDNIYKYTYGETTDYEEAKNKLQEAKAKGLK